MINIADELHNDFITYAEEVNGNRAFPDVRDGLKPSQRAVLWEMYSKGYSSNKPHVKSAKVDGGVISSWHPHGSEYSTIVRMSQPWVNNLSEVNFHGSNGSLLGGPQPAASRYTECRLDKVSEDGYFSNIKKNVVPFIPNFSEDMEWPSVLPSIFPRLFVNGSQGIGYTLAQEWEPGNLNEFYEKVKEYLKTNKVTSDNIYPDYPTGGVIINKKDLHTIYETGKGSVILRGKAVVDGDIISITELPYQVYAEQLIQEIKDLVNKGSFPEIEDVCNKSSDENGLLIEIQCNSNSEQVLNRLYKLTDLQCTFSANQMALSPDDNGSSPVMFCLKDYIKTYVNNNLLWLVREVKYDLDKSENRLEIVSGLIKAIDMIDDIITTIRKSKTSKDAVQALVKLGFTQTQSEAITDMKLSKLANTETSELVSEKTELEKLVEKYKAMLDSKAEQKKEFLKRLTDFTKQYGWGRRTVVTDIEQESIKVCKPKKEEESFIIFATKDGVHRVKLLNYKQPKESNVLIGEPIKLTKNEHVSIITSNGKLARIQAKKIPLSTMNGDCINIDNILYITSEFTNDVTMITSAGKIKRVSADELNKIHKKEGTVIFKLNEESIIYVSESNKPITAVVGKKVQTINPDDFNTRGKSSGGQKGFKVKEGTTIQLKENN